MPTSHNDAIRNPRMRKSSYTLLYYIGAVLLFLSCDSRTTYSHYQHVNVTGWEKNDAIVYEIPPAPQDGVYQETVGIRIARSFPFMGLSLIVDQTVYPSMRSYSDTLNCKLIDEEGNVHGQGISHYQFSFPIDTIHLHKGDSLTVSVRHDMKREILPGVTDIGMIMTRK